MVQGGTVMYVGRERIAICAKELLYWIDIPSTIVPFQPHEGMIVWVYIAEDLKKVTMVVEAHGERLEELPQHDPIEV